MKLSNSTHTSLMIRACVGYLLVLLPSHRVHDGVAWQMDALFGFAEADGVSDCLVSSVQGSWQGGGRTPAARAGNGERVSGPRE